MSTSIRFIIITVLPEAVAPGFDEARRRVCEIGGSRSALSYPPHVTLRTGVLVPVEDVEAFTEEIAAVAGTWDPFPVTTEGFLFTEYEDGEERKYLVGYRIQKDPRLTSLHERLLRYERWRASNRLGFEPHLTLAFDDLRMEGFQRIQNWFEGNPGDLPARLEWSCDNVGLYRRQGALWTLHREWRQ